MSFLQDNILLSTCAVERGILLVLVLSNIIARLLVLGTTRNGHKKITQGNRKTMSEENKIKEAYLIYYISPVYENQDCHDTYALPP